MIQFTHIIISIIFIFCNNASANDMSFGKVKSEVCSGCHGQRGISPFPTTPNLASQNSDYIISQLKAFKSGGRINDTMNKISASLNNNEIIALANYYSRQSPEIQKGEPSLVKKGKEIYSLCWSCHGQKGEGPGSYPRIAGQHSQYTVKQLKEYKKGSRINAAMKAIVSELSSDDMEALGAYIGTLSPISHNEIAEF